MRSFRKARDTLAEVPPLGVLERSATISISDRGQSRVHTAGSGSDPGPEIRLPKAKGEPPQIDLPFSVSLKQIFMALSLT